MAKTATATNFINPTGFFIPEAFFNTYNKFKTVEKEETNKINNHENFNITDAFLKAYSK